MLVFTGAAVLGAIITVATGSEPGSVLGDLIVLGAVIAALGVERPKIHRLFPLPALAYLVLAIITGIIHDSSAATSTTQLGVYFLQWIGSGFFAMFAATLLVGLVLGARMLAARQLVSGSFTMSSPRPEPAGGAGSILAPGGRPGSARDNRRPPQDEADAWYEEPRADPRRPDRDRRDDRDRRPGGRGGNAWTTDGWRLGNPRSKKSPERNTPERQAPERRAPEPKPPGQPGFTPRGSRDSRDSRDPYDSRDQRDSRDDRRPGFSPRPGYSPRDSGGGYGSRGR